jgi:hypothetical protein
MKSIGAAIANPMGIRPGLLKCQMFEDPNFFLSVLRELCGEWPLGQKKCGVIN